MILDGKACGLAYKVLIFAKRRTAEEEEGSGM